jgi:capsular exopolysaccharide synthesis family protein
MRTAASIGDALAGSAGEADSETMNALSAPRSKLDDHLVSLLAPASFEAEQYRLLRLILEKLHKGPKLTVIGVTSPSVGDGKTTTAINVAGALAQNAEARVLLVDGDLRRPSVSSRLGIADKTGPGLSGAVARGGELSLFVRRLPEFNLSVLPAGAAGGSVYEVLQSPKVGELLERAREAYDYVVVDLPPVLLVPDCRVVSGWLDAFLLVVRAHQTPRKLVGEALTAMGPTKLVGIVFNGDDRPLYSSYKKYYGYDKRARSSQRKRSGDPGPVGSIELRR